MTMSPENQQHLAELTRKSLAKLLDQARRTAELLDDLERQAAERRHGSDDIWDDQRNAATDVSGVLDLALREFDRTDPALYCSHGSVDKEACAEGAHDQ